MKPDQFRDEALGWWSSHPVWTARRRHFYQGIACIPLVAAIVFIVFVALHPTSLRPSAKSAPLGFSFFLAIAAATLGALMTLGLCAKWAELQRSGKVGRGRRQGPFPPGAKSVIVVTCLFGIVGSFPYLLAGMPHLRPPMRLLFHAFAAFPLIAALLSMWLLGFSQDERAQEKRRPLLVVLLILVMSLLLLTLTHDLAVTFRKSGISRWCTNWIPWYTRFEKLMLGALVLPPIALIIYGFWELWRKAVSPAPDRPKSEPPKPVGIAPRLRHILYNGWNWLRATLTRGVSGPEEIHGSGAPRWLRLLIDSIKGAPFPVSPPSPLENPSSSPMSEGDDLKVFFAGLRPTVDQARAFDRFINSFAEILEGGESTARGGGGRPPCADLLIEGPMASGRTTLLLACALYAAFARGQRVFFLVPDVVRRDLALSQLHAFLQEAALHYYVRVDSLSRQNVRDWLQNRDAIPHVLVITPGELEEHLFGARAQTPDLRDKLRLLILLFDVILVDDLMDLDQAARCHLPFLLGKHRLLLAIESIPIQTVIVCPQLGDAGRNLLADRFFALRRFDMTRNVLVLRPRPCGAAWKVDIRTGDVGRAIIDLGTKCLEEGKNVLIYRPGLSEAERRRQESELQARAAKSVVRVVTLLDQVDQFSPLAVDAIIHESERGTDVSMALRLHVRQEQCVVFCVSPAESHEEEVVEGIIPVFTARSATPLLVAHLESALRFIRPGHPSPAMLWSEFGIQYAKLPRSSPDALPSVVFEYDEWDERREDGAPEYGAELWPYVVLSPSDVPWRSLALHGVPDETRRVFRDLKEPSFYIGRRGAPDEEQRWGNPWVATWVDDGGEALAAVDLVHSCELMLVWGGERLVPGRVRVDDGRYAFLAARWQGNNSDLCLPVFWMKWTLPPTVWGGEIAGGSAQGITWMDLRSPDEDLIRVEAAIVELMNGWGISEAVPVGPIKFGYAARISALILGTGPPPGPSEPFQAPSSDLVGDWEVSGETGFWPTLTSAVNFGLDERLPGLKFHARAVAFRSKGEVRSLGRTFVFLVEPWSAGRTVLPVLNELLRNPAERTAFFTSIRSFLTRLRETGENRQRFARRYCRLGFKGDERMNDIDEALCLIEDVLTRTHEMLGKYPQSSPGSRSA